MKNRKRIITAFVLLAFMLVGVGYAAVTDQFTINGQAVITDKGATDSFNEDVRFEGIVVEGTGETATVKSDVLASENRGYTASCNVPLDEASFHVNGLKKQNDTLTITYRIRNYGDIDAVLNLDATNPLGTNDKSEVFTVTYDLQNGTALAAKSYVDVKVTVTIANGVTEETTGNFVFKFTANAD